MIIFREIFEHCQDVKKEWRWNGGRSPCGNLKDWRRSSSEHRQGLPHGKKQMEQVYPNGIAAQSAERHEAAAAGFTRRRILRISLRICVFSPRLVVRGVGQNRRSKKASLWPPVIIPACFRCDSQFNIYPADRSNFCESTVGPGWMRKLLLRTKPGRLAWR